MESESASTIFGSACALHWTADSFVVLPRLGHANPRSSSEFRMYLFVSLTSNQCSVLTLTFLTLLLLGEWNGGEWNKFGMYSIVVVGCSTIPVAGFIWFLRDLIVAVSVPEIMVALVVCVCETLLKGEWNFSKMWVDIKLIVNALFKWNFTTSKMLYLKPILIKSNGL